MYIDVKPIRTRAYDLFEKWITSFKPFHTKKCCLLYGDIGVGKTFIVKTVGKKYGYDVVYLEKNMLDKIDTLITRSRTITGSKKILHIDRPYSELGVKSYLLRKICRETLIPVVIEDTYENIKYYHSLKCEEIRVEPPPVLQIIPYIRKYSIVSNIDYKLAGRDIRQTLLLAYGSVPEHETLWIKFIEKLVMGGEPRGFQRTHLPLIIDNITCFYGVDLVNLVTIVSLIDRATFPRTESSLNFVEEMDLSPFLHGIKPVKPTKHVENYYYVKLREYRESQSK